MSDQQWQVAGNAAQTYEQHLVPAIFAAWAPRVLALAAPAPGQRLLDVACGTGVVADRPQPGVRRPSPRRWTTTSPGGGCDQAPC